MSAKPVVSTEQHGDVALVLIDNPPVNATSAAVRAGLLAEIERANADPATKAIVIACAGRTFVAGADIREFGKPPQPPSLPDTIAAIESGSKPVVAAIHGTALGGGFEITLGAHARVAVADAKIGLPEVKLGILPGAGGTQRLPRLVGPVAALDICASGRMVPAAEAHRLGIIDEIVGGDLREAAIAKARAMIGQPIRRAAELAIPAFDPAAFDQAASDVIKKARGALAPAAIVDCVRMATTVPFADGVAAERQTFLKLVVSDQAKAMRYVFFGERDVLKVPHLDGVAPRAIATVGVIGAGTMGAGIAISLVDSGLPVTLIETNQEALDRGVERITQTWQRSVKLGRMTDAQLVERRARLTPTTNFAALGTCDLIIEAVFEEMAIKKDVFAKLGQVAKAGAVLASNTSYLDINEIAAASGRPTDVIGMHFFSPANIMRLVEVIQGRDSALDVVATGVAIGKRMGKLPVVMGVCDGFVGNRILAVWRQLADMLVEEGALPQDVDAAMEGWGMAMGPYAVADLAGLDIGMRRRREFAHLRDPEKRYSATIADRLCALGRFGQKTGAGYYTYDNGRRIVDPAVTDIVESVSQEKGIARRAIPREQITRWIHAAMVNEACRILSENIVSRPLDIDMVKLNGYGFPIWRGGPLCEADRVGLAQVLETMREVHRMAGKGFEPAALLEWMIAHGKSFADLQPGEAKGR